MNRIAARLFAGAATAALASALVVSAASAATATLTVKISSKPIVSGVTGALVKEGVIAATASVAGTVAFSTAPDTATAGTPIKGCEAVAAVASGTSFVATCSDWKPTTPTLKVFVLATLTPTDATIAKVDANVQTLVSKPINESGDGTGISLYVDTVNGSSTPVVMTNKGSTTPYVASGGCLLMSQFMQGQQIVWRIYANDYYRDGIPLTDLNAKMSLTIAGWETPVALTYGDHSGTSFWAGALNTGTPGSGKYSTIGLINYTINITLLDAPAVTKDVMVTKYVKVLNAKTKKPVKINGAYVWKPVKVKETQIVTPAVVGKTISMQPAAWQAAASNLTLSAKA